MQTNLRDIAEVLFVGNASVPLSVTFRLCREELQDVAALCAKRADYDHGSLTALCWVGGLRSGQCRFESR